MPTRPAPEAAGPHPVPAWRFFLLFGFFALALCAGYAGAVLHSTSWAQARQLDAIFPFYTWRTRQFSAAALRHSWQGLAALAALSGTGLGLLAAPANGRRELHLLAQQCRAVGAAFWRALATLTARQRRWALGGLLGLTLLRTYLSQTSVTPEYDDAASYTLFVSQGLFVTASYYPLPNNHVLANALSWLFFQAHPGFWWTMRLPVLLAATAATVLLFGGLLHRRLAFRPAMLAVLLFSVSQLSLYHSSVGRGYWLLTTLAALMFFAALALGESTRQARAAWAILIGSGILGTYTVPVFAVVVGSACSWLGWRFWQRQAWACVGFLFAAGLLMVTATLLLYAPVLLVSGPAIFFGNGFVAPQPVAQFLTGLPLYLWQTEGFLAGQVKVGAVLTVAVLAAAWLLWRRVRQGRVSAAQATAWRNIAPAALWFATFPYVVLAAQRVFAPGRTLLYKGIFFFVFVALVIEWLLQHPRFRRRLALRTGLAAAALFWTSYQLVSLWRDNRAPHQHNADYHAAFAWLARQPRGPVLVPEPTHSIFLRMYFRSELPGPAWQLDGRPQPGRAYPYVVAFPDKRGYFQPRFNYAPAFRNAEVEIYRVPVTATVPAGLPAYWYLNEHL